MTLRMAGLVPVVTALLMAGCGGKSEAVCGGAVLKGDFARIGQVRDDPAFAVAISTAAKVTRSSESAFAADHIGYEGRTRGDGARCFQFVPKSCDIGGGVTMCVTPALEAQDVTASE
jgi:hypothetical protein